MSVRTWADLTTEVFRHRPRQAPRILAAAVNAKLRAGLSVGKVMSSGLWERPFAAARDYMSYWGPGELRETLRLVNWHGDGRSLCEDKLVTSERFAKTGIRALPILAVIGRDEATHPQSGIFPSLRTACEVIEALAAAPDDIFIKPVAGRRGKGAKAFSRLNGRWADGDEVYNTHELAAHLLGSGAAEGMLLQPRIRSHPGLDPIGGSFGLSCIRINTALLSNGPAHLFHFFKIMGQPGAVDNFLGGRNGNILAQVDPDSGTIVRAFTRRPNHRFLLTEVTRHPSTGGSLVGFQVPLWRESVDLALKAAASCAEAPLVGSDVAITQDGPIMVEINAAWDSDYPELLSGQGARVMLRRIWNELQLDPHLKERAATMLRLH